MYSTFLIPNIQSSILILCFFSHWQQKWSPELLYPGKSHLVMFAIFLNMHFCVSPNFVDASTGTISFHCRDILVIPFLVQTRPNMLLTKESKVICQVNIMKTNLSASSSLIQSKHLVNVCQRICLLKIKREDNLCSSLFITKKITICYKVLIMLARGSLESREPSTLSRPLNMAQIW